MLVPILLFALGLVCLIKGGDWFVDGASKIAKRFKIPEIIIGATIVSIGTTLPETMVSATSAVTGHPEIAYGNAIGSIICNTSLICAITITFSPSKVDKKSMILPVIFFFISAIAYAIISYTSGYFYRWTGILFLVSFVIYLFVTIYRAIKQNKKDKNNEISVQETSDEADEVGIVENDEETNETEKENKFLAKHPKLKAFTLTIWFELILLVIGAALIAVGADLLVDNGTLIAQAIGVPEAVIGLTFVALGTSLPELVTAITSLVKGHSSLSLGNIIGANLFNIIMVSGMAITLSPFAIPESTLINGISMSLLIEIPVMFAVMLILTVPALITGKLKRWQGILLLAIYVAFVVVQFILTK